MSDLYRQLPEDPNVPSGADGLDLLADWLAEMLPKHRYNHAQYTKGRVENIDNLIHGCGTAVCALGCLPLIPQFVARGWQYWAGFPFRHNKDDDPISSATEEFGIHIYTAVPIFVSDIGKSRDEVISQLRELADKLRRESAP